MVILDERVYNCECNIDELKSQLTLNEVKLVSLEGDFYDLKVNNETSVNDSSVILESSLRAINDQKLKMKNVLLSNIPESAGRGDNSTDQSTDAGKIKLIINLVFKDDEK